MSIDRQRIAAVKLLEALGYRFDAIEWKAPPGVAAAPTVLCEADALLGLLILRADKLEGCMEGARMDGRTFIQLVEKSLAEVYAEEKLQKFLAGPGRGL